MWLNGPWNGRWNDHLVIFRWNQCKYIALDIFSCKSLISYYKMLITTRISNEKPNALIIHGILCRNVTIFYRQELTSLFQVQKKLHGGGEFETELFELSYCRWQSCTNCMGTCRSFLRPWYFAFLPICLTLIWVGFLGIRFELC